MPIAAPNETQIRVHMLTSQPNGSPTIAAIATLLGVPAGLLRQNVIDHAIDLGNSDLEESQYSDYTVTEITEEWIDYHYHDSARDYEEGREVI